MSRHHSMIWVVVLLTLFLITRWPGLMPLNFSLAYALVFCAGAFRTRIPWWLVLSLMLVSDILMNVLYYDTPFFSDYMAINYLAYTAIFFLGRGFGRHASVLRLATGGFLGALVFYIITNTGAWLYLADYPKSLAGWIQALTVGVQGWPETWTFFRNTLLSGGLFTGLVAAFLHATAPAEAEVPEPKTEEIDEPAPEESKT